MKLIVGIVIKMTLECHEHEKKMDEEDDEDEEEVEPRPVSPLPPPCQGLLRGLPVGDLMWDPFASKRAHQGGPR